MLSVPRKTEMDELLRSFEKSIFELTSKTVIFKSSKVYDSASFWQSKTKDEKLPLVSSKIMVKIQKYILKADKHCIPSKDEFEVVFRGAINGQFNFNINVIHDIGYDAKINPIIVTKNVISQIKGSVYFHDGWKGFKIDLEVLGDDGIVGCLKLLSGNRHKPGRMKFKMLKEMIETNELKEIVVNYF